MCLLLVLVVLGGISVVVVSFAGTELHWIKHYLTVTTNMFLQWLSIVDILAADR